MQKVCKSNLYVKFKLLSMTGCRLDDNLNLVFVGGIADPVIYLPSGLHGLIDVGFSGLCTLEVLKFNKDLVQFNITALSNCKNLKEIKIFSKQYEIVKPLMHMYPTLKVPILDKE